MAIKSIRVKNFKSFKDVEVHLGNFNVLIGANASGKSNFIQVIKFCATFNATAWKTPFHSKAVPNTSRT